MSDLWNLTASEITSQIHTGDITARAVTEAVLARIDTVNPPLNAVIARCDAEALAAADAVDAAHAAGQAPGLLAGVPITIKVNADQAGYATTNGLRTQKDLIATQDNPVVANLRKAGAVIVGRTNTPAFSLRWFTRNSLHGHTKNPRNPALTPGGSSGGAAAAVAAGMGPLAHGTDIAGSVRYPAYACGLHGLRPSLGRVPAYNFTGVDRHIGGQLMAVAGPIARSIADLRLGLEAMAAPDLRDAWYMPAPLRGPDAPRRAALCLAPDGMEVAPEIKTALRDAAARLEAAGWIVEEQDTPPLREAMMRQLTLWLAETRRAADAAIRTEDDPDANLVYERLSAFCPPVDVNGLLDTLQARSRLAREWRAFLSDWPVLLCPVSGELPFADQRDVGSQADFDAVVAAQMAQIGLPFMGLPSLSVATGTVTGPHGPTPVGVQLVANQFREDLLLDAGEVIGDTVPVSS
ncbi:amidase family protein [Antarcticimicrobium sediminis]|uniref:Amidase n=1 Tax=Antarcticimicrobium sediminis TaxID=2546227 RepID=A0A4R5ESN0_9RHOB|nr:amidase family protein [Antarcticimicrobium sediminis]TDE37885.1 amidase [Antarcticimicrobium sediminis]